MISPFTRLWRIVLWLLVSAMVVLAIAVTTLRVALPQMNRFQGEIQHWINQNSGFEFELSEVKGFWRNTHPSIALKGLQANLPDGSKIYFSAQQIDVEFDLIQSLLQLQPVIADLSVHQLKLDIRSVNWLELNKDDNPQNNTQSSVIHRLDNLLLRQLDDFALLDSTVFYQSVAGDIRQLDIERLRWQNNGAEHKAEGVVSIADTSINSLLVSANFEDHGSLLDISGNFYVSADNIKIGPWLTRYLKDETGIEKGNISFDGWLTAQHNQPVDGYVELKPSELVWHDERQHDLLLESGTVKLSPVDKGWQVNAYSLKLRTDDDAWPDLDVAFDWHPSQWRLNLSQLDIKTLLPLVKLAPDSSKTNQLLQQLNFGGTLEDIRLSKGETLNSLKYSAKLNDGSMAQWKLLPEVHHLQAAISGNTEQARAKVTLIDDVLPYGEVFQAPLNIRQAEVDIVWQQQVDGWSLWADKVTAATPDLQVLGAFRLDFPEQKSPLLSFYAEADLYNAGETWRYLPTLAMGRSLTDYLSTAIQAGKVTTSKLLWYGELADFPYDKNNGMFQAWVGLKQAKFSFDTAWPPITDLQLDLLFENDVMYLDSHSATLMDVTAKRITGRIPKLAPGGHIEIEATAIAQGNAVRDYMTSTPLVDSVGAALTAIQVSGEVQSQFQLNIPFDHDREARAWGWADLNSNHVQINAPPMTLDGVSGRIEFDNDVVTAAGLSAELLTQPISVDFKGENVPQGYSVKIDALGDWDIKPLTPFVGERWVSRLGGHAPWQMGVDLQLNDIGFTYQIDSTADMKMIESDYPYPLKKSSNVAGRARLQAFGNQESITARLQLPQVKYQAEIDITPNTPVLTATNLVVGNGNFRISPVVGHHALIRSDQFDLDQWLNVANEPQPKASAVLDKMNTPTIPQPEKINVNVKELMLAGLEWHDVDFSARRKNLGWLVQLDSQEVKGQASYIEPYDLSVSLERLHVYIPSLDTLYDDNNKNLLVDSDRQAEPLISDFDRQFHQLMPNLTLAIDDFWLQGYKIGQLNMDFQRHGDTLEWKSIDINSGTNQINIDGTWTLSEQTSHTVFNLNMKGDNNSDVMERFGISSGIQKAPFELSTESNWDGAPWSMKINTLQGQLRTKLGKGIISDVSGAARLLGLFSLDSIIRKMQLDFSDVFDKGMAFNSITGSGEISQGVFVTNNIEMDAVAGDMKIKGLANLNTRIVDAEVNFVPDITSGIPVLTAFAVTPQTALYVLAITTVIAPVVEVFSQVNYEVKGPINAPVVKELSRSKGEFKLPEKLRNIAEK
ncbi:putative exported protein [Vibrio aestuarianus]|nr:putative exported protein [Vibrio aestuarianus]